MVTSSVDLQPHRSAAEVSEAHLSTVLCLLREHLSHSLSGAMLTVDVLSPCSSQKLLHLLVSDMSALKFAVTSQFY